MGKVADICERFHGGSRNSAEANEFIQPAKKALGLMIYDYIESRGKMGATCQEAERDLNLKHQTASARFSELKQTHQIHWNGLKRALPGSRPASAYVTSKGQLFLLETQ